MTTPITPQIQQIEPVDNQSHSTATANLPIVGLNVSDMRPSSHPASVSSAMTQMPSAALSRPTITPNENWHNVVTRTSPTGVTSPNRRVSQTQVTKPNEASSSGQAQVRHRQPKPTTPSIQNKNGKYIRYTGE